MSMSRSLQVLFISCLSAFSFQTYAQSELETKRVENFNLAKEVQKFKARYRVTYTSTKLTSNRGEGRYRLYGTRNFRVVLQGVLYRGGANNRYMTPRRNNMNPLPTVGLKNLCKEDFSTAVYLYSQRYSKAPKQVSCASRDTGEQNTLRYKQYSPLSEEKRILKLVYDRIKGRLDGPIYTHCWNGWHASGLISAMALKQFCGWSKSEVRAYWVKNTDGNSRGHSRVLRKLKYFKPYSEYNISSKERSLICPTKVISPMDMASGDEEP